MELSVSGGISRHSQKMVYKTRLRPLTQSSTKLLTQQSWEKQRKRGKEQWYEGKKNVGGNQSEKNRMSTHSH